jgi:hypothetical protein
VLNDEWRATCGADRHQLLQLVAVVVLWVFYSHFADVAHIFNNCHMLQVISD